MEHHKGNLNHGGASIKLCFFSSLASFDTGMPICTFKLIRHFSNNPEYEVHLIVPEPGELVARLQNEKVKVEIIPFSRLRSARRGADFFRFCVGWPAAVVRISGYLKRNKINIVHFSDFIDAPFYPAAKLGKAEIVAHLRLCIEKPLQRWFFSVWAGIFARKVVCISNAVRKLSGLRDSKTEVVPDPGPDYSLFDPSRAYPTHPALDERKIHLTTIAKFLWVKGHDFFIRMAALVENSLPGAVQFVIVGDRQKGHERFFDEITCLARELDIQKAIAIIGQVPHDEIPALLSHTDIFVHLPRYQEGLGGVVGEAMAMGVPVVAFDSGGVGECFRDQKDGYLIPHHDFKAAADKVISLAKDHGLRKKMGGSAMAYVRERFSLSRHMGAVELIYRDMLKARVRSNHVDAK